jgi:hypothetical protein
VSHSIRFAFLRMCLPRCEDRDCPGWWGVVCLDARCLVKSRSCSPTLEDVPADQTTDSTASIRPSCRRQPAGAAHTRGERHARPGRDPQSGSDSAIKIRRLTKAVFQNSRPVLRRGRTHNADAQDQEQLTVFATRRRRRLLWTVRRPSAQKSKSAAEDVSPLDPGGHSKPVPQLPESAPRRRVSAPPTRPGL